MVIFVHTKRKWIKKCRFNYVDLRYAEIDSRSVDDSDLVVPDDVIVGFICHRCPWMNFDPKDC